MFPTAPTAHNEKAQANGLGIGHNNRSQGLKARDNHPRGIHQIKPVLKSSNHSNAQFPGVVSQVDMVRTFGAGEGNRKTFRVPCQDFLIDQGTLNNQKFSIKGQNEKKG